MTPFRDWPEKQPFELREGIKTRFGVKLAPMVLELQKREDDAPTIGEEKYIAFMFDTNQIEYFPHNKNVSKVRAIHRGRLARTHDNRLIVVEEVTKGRYAGYYVNLTGRQDFTAGEITLIPVGAGNRQTEVDITLKKLGKVREIEQNLFRLLQLELVE